eukprot:3214404-Amphidinium_carterae.4
MRNAGILSPHALLKHRPAAALPYLSMQIDSCNSLGRYSAGDTWVTGLGNGSGKAHMLLRVPVWFSIVVEGVLNPARYSMAGIYAFDIQPHQALGISWAPDHDDDDDNDDDDDDDDEIRLKEWMNGVQLGNKFGFAQAQEQTQNS